MRISDWSSDVCSSDLTRNFLDFQERKSIWESAIIGEFGADTLARTSFIGQEDLGNPVRWASAVEQKVSQVIRHHAGNPDDADVAIFGHRKDPTSFYLDDFPNYVLEEVSAVEGKSSTQQIGRASCRERVCQSV